VSQYNIVATICSVHLVQNVMQEFAQQSVQMLENALANSFVFKEFVNQLAEPILAVPISNIVLIIYVYKNSVAVLMQIVILMKTALLILMVVQNVEMPVMVEFYVDVMQNVQLESIPLFVDARPAFTKIIKEFVERLNVKPIMSAQMIKNVTITCAKLHVLWVNHVEKTHCAQPKIINKFAIVSLDLQETHQ